MSILRSIVTATSGMLLLFAVMYGPGRGMSLVPADDTAYGLLKILAYGLFTAGAFMSRKRPRLATFALGAGLIARMVLELKYSSGRLWFDHRTSESTGSFLAMVTFYLFSFILPGLLFLGCRRAFGRDIPK